MADIIAFIIFLGTAIVIAVIAYRKIPDLSHYIPQQPKKMGILFELKERVKSNVMVKAASSSEFMLLKVLSKSRVMILKAENRIGFWLNALRQKSIEKKKDFEESYWEKIKAKKKEKRERKYKETLK